MIATVSLGNKGANRTYVIYMSICGSLALLKNPGLQGLAEVLLRIPGRG